MNQKDRASLIAELLQKIHGPGSDNLEALRELLALTGESNQIDWAITAAGLKEYLHRLVLAIHSNKEAKNGLCP